MHGKVGATVLILCVFRMLCCGFYVSNDTARTEGMCSSGTSDVGSVEAVVKNPALAFSENLEILVDYRKFFLRTKNLDIEGFIPADISNILLAMCLPLDKKISAGVATYALQTVENFYSQKMFSVVLNFKAAEFQNVTSYVGIKPKILYTTFENTEIIRDFLFDLAFSAEFQSSKFSLLYQAATVPEQRNFIFAGTYMLKNNLTLNTDVVVNSFNFIPILGIEFWYKNLALRSGVSTTKLSFGVGVELNKLAFDISSVFPYRFFEIIPSLRITFIYRP